MLSAGMSQPTTNLIASLYNIPPRVLLLSQQHRGTAKSNDFYGQTSLSCSSASSEGESFHSNDPFYRYQMIPQQNVSPDYTPLL
jgi:hypothetical protein